MRRFGRPDADHPAEHGADEGISLVETLIGMFLAAILGTIVMQALIASSQGARHVSDDAAVQQQQQTVVERLSRDLRVARGIDSTSTGTRVRCTTPRPVTSATLTRVRV